MNMNKNWGDRADRDLFFNILFVKNIGVISGAEWAAIGNAMRIMGYGFTNEGCRQHFQNLRRLQHKKATAASTNPDGTPKYDPVLNPIARRPGPGRGRPRKNAAAQPEAGTSLPPVSTLGDFPGPVPAGPRQLMPGPHPAIGYHHAHFLPARGPAPQHLASPPRATASAPPQGTAQAPPPPVSSLPSVQPVAPVALMTENDDAPGEDEPPSKRPRIEGIVAAGVVVLGSSGLLEEESADDLEDDDEDEEFANDPVFGPEPEGTDRQDEISNHDAEDAVLALIAASGEAPVRAASHASTSSWGTPPEARFDAPED